MFLLFLRPAVSDRRLFRCPAPPQKTCARILFMLPADADQAAAEAATLANEVVQKWLEGKTPKKFIFVKGRMINVVM